MNCCFFSKRSLASGAQVGTVIVWDVEQGDLLRQIAGHEGVVHMVAFEQEGVWSAGSSNGARCWIWINCVIGCKATATSRSLAVNNVRASAWTQARPARCLVAGRTRPVNDLSRPRRSSRTRRPCLSTHQRVQRRPPRLVRRPAGPRGTRRRRLSARRSLSEYSRYDRAA